MPAEKPPQSRTVILGLLLAAAAYGAVALAKKEAEEQ